MYNILIYNIAYSAKMIVGTSMSQKGKCYCYRLITIRSTNTSTRNEQENIYDVVEMNRQESHIRRDDSVPMEKNVAYESVGF